MGKDENLLIHLLIQKSELINSLAIIHRAKNFVIMQKKFFMTHHEILRSLTRKKILYNSAHTQKIILRLIELKRIITHYTKKFIT